MQMHIAVAADSTGHANLSVTFCHLSINDLHIDFHGGDSWLYNLFSKFISDDLKGSLDSQVQPHIFVCCEKSTIIMMFTFL